MLRLLQVANAELPSQRATEDGRDDSVFRAIAETPMEWKAVGVSRARPPMDVDDSLRRIRNFPAGPASS